MVAKASGLGGPAKQISIGMKSKELFTLLKGQRADWLQRYIADTKVGYRFFRRLGLAVHIEGDRVEELAVAQIPYQKLPKN